MTSTRRGKVDVRRASDVAHALGAQHALAVAELRTQAEHRALRFSLVEVGHDARDVRQAADGSKPRLP